MAGLTKTKIQQIFGSIAALVIMIVFAAVAAAMTGRNVPGLNIITDAMGIPVATE
jgi:hypothetical protein